jgi:hypothetical protein
VAVVVDGFDSYPLGKLLELEKPAVEYLWTLYHFSNF